MMRSARTFAFALALASLAPAAAIAQEGRNFEDAWFWGAKVGTMSFATKTSHDVAAPMIGAEWLITRSKGGLYISAEQSWFNKTSSIDTPQGEPVNVAIHDMERVTVAALAFPGIYGHALRPYAGVGFALNFIKSAAPIDSVPASGGTTVPDAITEERTGTSVIVIAGVQAQYRRFSVFGQGDVMPTKSFLFNARATYTLSAGIRWNFGTSIERPE